MYLEKKLHQKGWSKEDITKTITIIRNAEEQKEPFVKHLDQLAHGSVLVASIFITLGVSLSMIPLLIVFRGFFLYSIVFVIAISFGYFFENLLQDIKKLERKHHLWILIVTPLFALINFFVIVQFAQPLARVFGVTQLESPYLVGLCYVLGFLFPYFYYQAYRKKGP